MNSNNNNGFVNITGLCSGICYGGFVGFHLSTKSSVSVINNTNNGNVFLDVKLESTLRSIETGGLYGRYSGMVDSRTVFENNTNNGSIEGSIESSVIHSGGLIGGLDAHDSVSIRGNANYGMINITHIVNYADDDFSGGIIGKYSGIDGQNMSDNANYGHIITNSSNTQSTAVVCGLVCTERDSKMKIENSVNKGNVEGTNAYGISNGQIMANNVVNMGVIKGKNISYSFWDIKWDTGTSLYSMDDTCVNCSTNVSLFAMNESDGRYHTINNEHEVVDSLLNEEADKNEYYLRWDRNLMLRKPIIIHIHIGNPVNMNVEAFAGMTLEECGIPYDVLKYHMFTTGSNPSTSYEYNRTSAIYDDIDFVPYIMIRMKGEVSGIFYVEATKRGEYLINIVESLKDYIETNDYAVGDSDTNVLLDAKTTVTSDMNVIVMKRNRVEIELNEPVLTSEVNASEIALAISEFTGIATTDILIDLLVNEEGYVIQVSVFLSGSDECENVYDLAVTCQELAKRGSVSTRFISMQ